MNNCVLLREFITVVTEARETAAERKKRIKNELRRHVRNARKKKEDRIKKRVSSVTAEKLFQKYPAIHDEVMQLSSDDLGSLESVLRSQDPQRLLEVLAVYTVLSNNGPDVMWERVSKVLPRVRKALGTTPVLAAYEDGGQLYDVLNDLGYFGRGGDDLRDEGDMFW